MNVLDTLDYSAGLIPDAAFMPGGAIGTGHSATALREARAAVAELIEAQRMAHDAMLLADWNVPGKVSERKHAAYLASAAALARVGGAK